MLTNDEVRVALECDAVVVREDADFEAIPVEDPRYRGRTFNRLMNSASRGRIARLASAKLAWAGIPEIVIPSYYTSSCDYRNAVVDKAMRKGETFKARDGMVRHADQHAGETIAQWLLLRPLAELGATG